MGGGEKRSGGQGGGASKKARYLPQKGNGQCIPLGKIGILVTCDNGWEDRTSDEMCPVVEEHYDKLVKAKGGDAAAAAAPAAPAAAPEEGSKDIASLIAQEVAVIKDRKNRRFQTHNMGVKGCLFIMFPEEPVYPGPIDVVLSICEEAAATKTLRGRHVNRILPITHTCFASVDEMKVLAPKLLGDQFPAEESAAAVEFAVEYEHRSSDKFDRLQVINAFVDAIKTPPHKVNLKTPSLTILVQLARNSCACAVVPKYRELHKFNLRKCAEVPEEGAEGAAGAAG
eukprot:CAMPEP_0202858320 /NCGR_PEP_ID=MMETSP1391-20130828/908_1 /ASSEMBLY_ACC=CAM_ASM_000867 /TAXON_ID=1034604 /ORGANISM="Chlamydomonas leiostraca, Strain SAG 11-49" /LENGTH=283 /DNA_ID=CAMNT_0049537229 /DNA_START=21 /DNA_END=868 /DNA_ORIENTATION=+